MIKCHFYLSKASVNMESQVLQQIKNGLKVLNIYGEKLKNETNGINLNEIPNFV